MSCSFFFITILHIILVSGEHLHMRFRCATNLTQDFLNELKNSAVQNILVQSRLHDSLVASLLESLDFFCSLA